MCGKQRSMYARARARVADKQQRFLDVIACSLCAYVGDVVCDVQRCCVVRVTMCNEQPSIFCSTTMGAKCEKKQIIRQDAELSSGLFVDIHTRSECRTLCTNNTLFCCTYVPRGGACRQWHTTGAGDGHHCVVLHGVRRLCGEVLSERIRHDANHWRGVSRILMGVIAVLYRGSGGCHRVLPVGVLCVVQCIRCMLDVHTMLLYTLCVHSACAPLLSGWQWWW